MCHLEMLRRTTLNAGSVLMLLVEKALSCETQQIGWACFKEGARASTKHHWGDLIIIVMAGHRIKRFMGTGSLAILLATV